MYIFNLFYQCRWMFVINSDVPLMMEAILTCSSECFVNVISMRQHICCEKRQLKIVENLTSCPVPERRDLTLQPVVPHLNCIEAWIKPCSASPFVCCIMFMLLCAWYWLKLYFLKLTVHYLSKLCYFLYSLLFLCSVVKKKKRPLIWFINVYCLWFCL